MEKEKVTCYFSLGTNLGNKPQNLFDCINHIDQIVGRVTNCSNFYSSPPFEMESSNEFWNCVIEVETTLAPTEILVKTQEIELETGRTIKSVNQVYTDRLIDIDLLFYGEKQFETKELTIPHPKWSERLFVLIPLKELQGIISISDKNYELEELINIIEAQTIPNLALRLF